LKKDHRIALTEFVLCNFKAEIGLENHPIQAGELRPGLSEEDEELVISRLRDLGYV